MSNMTNGTTNGKSEVIAEVNMKQQPAQQDSGYQKTKSLSGYGQPKELRVPVPYGHIAAKEWGPPDGQPVLGIHGWQDNAGTMDLLVEHLPPTMRYVVIDLPGHGLSSHLPLGALYGPLLFVIDVRRVIEFLGWKRFSFLSHSLGAIVSIYYSAIHPEQVEKLVSLDILYPGVRTKSAQVIRKFMDSFFVAETREGASETYAHPEDTALELMWTHREGLTKEGAIPLLARGATRTENGLVFNRDHRLKPMLQQPWECESPESIFNLLKSVTTQMLVISATESSLTRKPEEVMTKTKQLLTQSCESFSLIEVVGTHFVHLNEPSLIAKPIVNFLCFNTE